MKISGNNESKQKPVDVETNKVSPQEAGAEAIEMQLFKLMTGSTLQKTDPNTHADLSTRVDKVAKMRDSLKGSPEHPLSDRLQLVVTAAEQWIKAKKAEASKILKTQ